MNVEQIIKRLNLVPHPEGGFFRETYRAGESIAVDALPKRYTEKRDHSTAIYYLLTADTFSVMHRVASDEVFHFYLGDPVEQLRLFEDGSSEICVLGSDIAAGQQPQSLVPKGVWQGARVIPGGAFALLGATVSPGFDFADYLEGTREDLLAKYPAQEVMITNLTRR